MSMDNFKIKINFTYEKKRNFPHFVVIHTVTGFEILREAEVDFFWNSFTFSMIQKMLAINIINLSIKR